MSFTDRALKFLIFKKFELARIFNVTFTAHSSLAIVACLLPLTAFSAAPLRLIYFALCHVLMLFFHELGHAFFCKINRLEVYEIHIGIVHGLCRHESPPCGYEYKNAYVAWGGVVAQGLLAVVALVLSITEIFKEYDFLFVFTWFMLTVNLKMALLNLFPIWRLDGAEAWKIFSSNKAKTKKSKRHLKSVN